MSETPKDSEKPVNENTQEAAEDTAAQNRRNNISVTNSSRTAQPVTNPELVDAMAKFKLDLKNRSNEVAFLQAAVAAKYLLPAMVEQPSEAPKPGEQVRTRVAFQIMTNPQNEKFMPAFTDEIELKKNRQPGERFQVAVMSFMDLYRFVKANEEIKGIVINPFGSALCLIRQQVIAIGDNGGKITLPPPPVNNDKFRNSNTLGSAKDKFGGSVSNSSEKEKIDLNARDAEPEPARPSNPLGAAVASADDAQAAIRQAMADMEAAQQSEEAADTQEAVTEGVISALKAALKKQKAVKKAYIRQEREAGESYLLVALETDGDAEEIGAAVTEQVRDASKLPFEFTSASSIRAKELVAEGKPFYEKKRFGIF